MLTKGAVDVLSERLTKIQTKDGIRDITRKDLEEIKKQNQEFSEQGLRVLAFAYKDTDQKR
jgi:Ca2+-transporting ATPase